MKILFLTPWYPDKKIPHHGVFVREQAAAVAQEHEVVLISSKVDYSRFKLFSWTLTESTFENVKEYRLLINRSLPFLNQLVYFGVSIYVSNKIAKGLSPDLIHGNIGYPGGFWTYGVAKLQRVPYIMSEHYSRFTYNFRSLIHRSLTLFSLKRASRIVSVSTPSAKEIQQYVKRSVDVVSNMVNTNRFTIVAKKSDVLQMGFIGGMSSDTHQKGLDLLLGACKHLTIDYALHIGGSGKYLEYYKELAKTYEIEDKCKFYGLMDYDAIPAFMNRLDFFISSSRFESFGIVMVEAMASGLPVLATNSGGPSDFINQKNGLLIEPNNEDALKNGILEMIRIQDKFNRDEIRNFAVTNFSQDRFKHQIMHIYQEVIRKGN